MRAALLGASERPAAPFLRQRRGTRTEIERQVSDGEREGERERKEEEEEEEEEEMIDGGEGEDAYGALTKPG